MQYPINQYSFPKTKRKNLITKIIIMREKGVLVSGERDDKMKIARSKVRIAPEEIVPIHPSENHQS